MLDYKKIINEIEIKLKESDELYKSSNSGFLRGYTEALRYCLNKLR